MSTRKRPRCNRDNKSLELQAPGHGYRQQQLIWNNLYTAEQQALMTAQCKELIDNGCVGLTSKNTLPSSHEQNIDIHELQACIYML